MSVERLSINEFVRFVVFGVVVGLMFFGFSYNYLLINYAFVGGVLYVLKIFIIHNRRYLLREFLRLRKLFREKGESK